MPCSKTCNQQNITWKTCLNGLTKLILMYEWLCLKNDGLTSAIICAIVKWPTSRTDRRAAKERESSPLWRTKIVMIFLCTTLTLCGTVCPVRTRILKILSCWKASQKSYMIFFTFIICLKIAFTVLGIGLFLNSGRISE